MKHTTSTTANGLCTPPCGSSQSKSTRFSFLTSFLLLFLLLVGSNAAWASTNYFTPGKTIYFHVDGSCAVWKNEGGYAVLFYYQNNENKAYGYENENYSARQFISNTNIGSSNRIKCTKINDNYYSAVVPSNGTASIGYVRLIHLNTDDGWCHQAQKKVSADSFTGTNNCVFYSGWDDADPGDNEHSAFEAYNSGECITSACGSGGGGASLQELSENYCLRGDLWLNGTADNAGWVGAGTTPSPAFTKNEDNTIATLKYVVPAISQGQILSRITLYGNDHSNYKNMSTVWDATNSNVVKDGSSDNEKGKLQVPQQSSFSPKQITLQVTNDGSGEKLKGTISDYTVKKNGWYLYVDEHCVGAMNSNGELIVSDPTYNTQGHHYVFIANSQRDGAISNPSSYWSQGISWFGGLYIDKSSSNVAWSSTQRKYYGDAFSNQAVFPTKGIRNGCGDFKLNSAAEFVKYKFDGGKITINTVSKQQINDTYVLVGDYQGGWNNQDNDHKFSDDHYTKTVSLTLAQNATGVQDKGANGKWFRFKGCKWNDWGTQLNRSNTILLGDDDVIDKNNSLGDEDDRILVKAPYETNVYTFTYFKIDGQNYLQIEVEEASETPHTGDKFYVMGSHNGWCKNCDDHKMTVVDGEYAYKTYENITDNWDFKVAKEDGTELGWSYFSQSKSNYTCTEVPATISNIRPNSYSGAKNLTIYWDGSNVYVHVEDYIAPTATYTVTLHPNNGGSNIERESVPEGSTSSAAELNLAAITYGTGTATWYTNEACTEPFTTVTGDMDLYAKWGVSGNYWLVGDQWMYDTGSSWNNGENPAFTTTDGVATVTFIAPMGRNRFEIIKNNNWGEKINNGTYNAVVNPSSPVSLSVVGGHMEFTLDEMKKVTIIYDGKVSVRAEAYDIHKTGWNIAGNSGLVGQEWNNSACPMDNNGEKILRNINTGNYEFKITPVGSWGIAAVNQFSAANVDKDNSTSNIFRNWTSHLFGSYKDGNEYKLPMNNKKDRNVCIQLTNDMAINGKADIKIAFDGAKITVNVLPKYTVTFNSNDGSEVAQQSVFEGTTASEPSAPTKAGYEFVKWQLSGVDYTFSEAVTGNITLDAVWAYKAISSVELNESAHTTWLGNSNFVLTLTKNPSDLITKSVVWSSDAEGVASVDNGTVHAAGVGTATITCTVTDMFDHVESASCEVSVAACEMTTDNLYSMTVTGYNSYSGDAALFELWNESSDNTEPATFRIVKLKLSNNYYIYDDNGTVKMSTDASLATAQWYEIPTNENFSPNWTGNNFALYEFKNVSTGKYLRRGEGRYGDNSSWYYYTTLTDNRETDGNIYKFFYDNTMGTHLVCREGVGNELRVSYALHNNNLNWPDGYSAHCAAPMVICGYTNDPNGNTYTKLHETVVVDPSYANPNYKASQMNSSYYRMKADATVRANLANGLAYGSVITVRLYADAATTVQLTKADGTEIETIDLSADAAREYTYTVAYGSELVGATAFIIKAADNHAGIASIEVSRTHAASPDDPALTWETDLSGGVTQSELAGTFQHVASSALSSGAIHYESTNPAVATVSENGTVTPIMAGSTIIKATIEAKECFGEETIQYNVTLTEPTLAELIAADAGAGITLTHDYAEDIVIDKAVTIDGAGHAIGNLTVQMAGDLTLSGALTVNDFSIYAKAGNTTTPAASGQVRNATNLTANGNAYFYYTVDPSEHIQYGWYDFTVPFRVNVMTGIKGIQNAVLNEDFVNERDYAVMEHLGEKQAAGEYAYKKFRGVMEPCRLYSITLDPQNNYNTIRFQKADGDLVADNSVTLNTYASTVDDKHANWNGVGNGTLHHADAGLSVATIQVYQSGNKTFLPVDRAQYSLVIGSAFMVQQTGTMTLNQATHSPLLAPKRAASVQPTAIQIASEGQAFSDQLFISADEMAGQGYTQGADVAKAGNIGNVNVPQIWTNAYNSKLCAHEAQLINGEAQYTLSLYAPANGSYTLTSKNIPEGYTLYLTQNGNRIWNLSERYVLDLTKGTATEYGLQLVENYKMPTAIENIGSKADETQKIMHNGILYILRNGKVFNAQGARVK